MNIIQLRLLKGCPAFKGENVFRTDSSSPTTIAMLPCGHFVVTKYGKSVLFTHAVIDCAEIEPLPEKKSKTV